MGDRGEVDDGTNAIEERAAIELGGYIRDDDLMQLRRNGARREAPPERGADRVSAREQLATKGGADEARCTGDENAHVRTAGRDAPPQLEQYRILASFYLRRVGATTIRALSGAIWEDDIVPFRDRNHRN